MYAEDNVYFRALTNLCSFADESNKIVVKTEVQKHDQKALISKNAVYNSVNKYECVCVSIIAEKFWPFLLNEPRKNFLIDSIELI